MAYCSQYKDQRLYRIVPGIEPVPLTPAAPADDPQAQFRFADGLIDTRRRLWIGVREDHRHRHAEAVNSLVAIDLERGGEGNVLVGGNDFYSSARLSPDGQRLAWLAWDHPDMPWTSTRLWVGELTLAGIKNAVQVAGGGKESIFQPEWSPEGRLYFVSDRTGWWNLHRWEGGSGSRTCVLAPPNSACRNGCSACRPTHFCRNMKSSVPTSSAALDTWGSSS